MLIDSAVAHVAAGAPEVKIEITHEMLRAGVAALKEHYLSVVADRLDEYPQIVESVFAKMEEARQ